ncbi:MAG: ABC transporter ATP-binding protein [Caldilinea sp. CFX5]|nr:ABC transporter ATP-binding protein [Caldilinea sp. CFX5]
MASNQEQATRRRTRWIALRLLVGAFPGRVAFLAALAILTGALPALFATQVATLVETLPTAVGGGFASADGQRIVNSLIIIGGVLLLQEVVAALYWITTTDLYRRYDGYLLARVMRTTLSAPRLALFETPELAAKTDRAARIARFGPGELVSGLAGQWMVRAQGIAAAVLVATVWPVAAVILAGIWLVVSYQLQADYYRANPFWADPLRRARYLKQLAIMPAWAKEVRIFGLVDWLGDRFGQQWALVMADLWRARRADQRTMTLLFTVVLVANALVILLAARAALQGTLSTGGLVVLVQGLLSMALLANQDSDILIENGAVPAPDVVELERTVATAITAPTGTMSARNLPQQAIAFEQVHFTYPGRTTPVYDGLDLRIEAGRSLAIVGLNGAGKTTLIKLLTGLETPQAGRITVDGIDLANLNLTEWRQTVAAIFQDFVRYELPARDNIGFGAVETLHDEKRDHRLTAVAQRAGAESILAGLPNGLDTPLSRRFAGGTDLSGGQWQRIALARAMAAVEAGARVLVLDEPTAHLDVRAEADLYDRFLDLTHGLTTIVISHRFSTVRRADRIVVLDNGRITEDGSHDELVAAGGQYAQLFQKQAMRYADQAPGSDDEAWEGEHDQ